MVSQDDDFGIPRCRVVDAEAYLPVALVPDEGRQEGDDGSQIEARFASAEAQFREGPFDFTPEMKNMLPDGIFNPIEGGPATEREYLRQHGWNIQSNRGRTCNRKGISQAAWLVDPPISIYTCTEVYGHQPHADNWMGLLATHQHLL